MVNENGNADPGTGYQGGVADARRALSDARSIGYPEHLPIFFSADGWLDAEHIHVPTAMSYLDGPAGSTWCAACARRSCGWDWRTSRSLTSWTRWSARTSKTRVPWSCQGFFSWSGAVSPAME